MCRFPRTMCNAMTSPGRSDEITLPTSCALPIVVLLMPTMMSPCLTPAAAAPVPDMTLMTTAPDDTVNPYSCCSEGVIDVISTPMKAPWLTTLSPALSCFRSDSIVASGMAKPMFCALVPSGNVPATAVFMPMTSPLESSSGPPEFPGLMAASVWIMLLSVSRRGAGPAVTVRPSAETMPEVTVGVPAARPSALPIATTASPTTSSLELPKVTGVKSGDVVDANERYVIDRVRPDERRGHRSSSIRFA